MPGSHGKISQISIRIICTSNIFHRFASLQLISVSKPEKPVRRKEIHPQPKRSSSLKQRPILKTTEIIFFVCFFANFFFALLHLVVKKRRFTFHPNEHVYIYIESNNKLQMLDFELENFFFVRILYPITCLFCIFLKSIKYFFFVAYSGIDFGFISNFCSLCFSTLKFIAVFCSVLNQG